MSEFQEIASVLKISKIFQNHMWSYIWKPQEKPKIRPNNVFLDFENWRKSGNSSYLFKIFYFVDFPK